MTALPVPVAAPVSTSVAVGATSSGFVSARGGRRTPAAVAASATTGLRIGGRRGFFVLTSLLLAVPMPLLRFVPVVPASGRAIRRFFLAPGSSGVLSITVSSPVLRAGTAAVAGGVAPATGDGRRSGALAAFLVPVAGPLLMPVAVAS